MISTQLQAFWEVLTKKSEAEYDPKENVFNLAPRDTQNTGACHIFEFDLHNLNPRYLSNYGVVARAMLSSFTGDESLLKYKINKASHIAVKFEYEFAFKFNTEIKNRNDKELNALAKNRQGANHLDPAIVEEAISQDRLTPFYKVDNNDRLVFLSLGLLRAQYDLAKVTLERVGRELRAAAQTNNESLSRCYLANQSSLEAMRHELKSAKQTAVEFMLDCLPADTQPSHYKTRPSLGQIRDIQKQYETWFTQAMLVICEAFDLNKDKFSEYFDPNKTDFHH